MTKLRELKFKFAEPNGGGNNSNSLSSPDEPVINEASMATSII